MKNQVATIDKKLVSTITKQGISDVLKPLTKEIELFDTYISGVLYTDKKILKSLKKGQKMILRREPDNNFDDQAVAILKDNDTKVGYVLESDNMVLARLLDAGKCMNCKIKSIDLKSDVPEIVVTIYLVDF